VDRNVETALRDLRRQDPELEAPAREAWEALTGGGGVQDVSQWWLQLFCWDQLARDGSSSPERRWQTARALAGLLERIGLRRYADIAQSEATRRVLAASNDARTWSNAYADALRESGIQPPDTDLITWGPVMGPAEADTYERVANALELSHVAGDVRVGGRGARAATQRVTNAVLTTSHRDLNDLAPLQGISDERLHYWTMRSTTLLSVVEPLTDALTVSRPPELTEPAGVLAPLQWLLTRLQEPVALTSSGYLPPGVVTALVDEVGLAEEVIGSSRRERDVPHVHMLREAVHRLGLVRVHRRALTLTPRGRAAARSGAELAAAVAAGWFPRRRGGEVVAREVVTAVLGAGAAVSPDQLARTVHAVYREEGWTVSGRGVSYRDAEEMMWETLRDLIYLQLIDGRLGGPRRAREAALPILQEALRHHLMHHGLTQQS
jgi:hypothetical protein